MLDASRLSGDFNNLNGLLLIKAHEVRTWLHYFGVASQEYEVFFGVASQEYEAFFSVVKCLSKIVDKTHDGNLDKLIENAEKQYKLTGHSHDFKIFGIYFRSESDISESDISYEIVPQTKIDIYDLGFVLNSEEYEHNADKVISDYFVAYNQQQSDIDY